MVRFKKTLFDGNDDENWGMDDLGYESVVRFYIKLETTGKEYKVQCNRLPFYESDISEKEYVRLSSTFEYFCVYIKKSRLNELSISSFKNWLQENPLEIVYKMETSTEEPTPEDLVAGLKKLKTYSSTTNVFLEGEVKPTLNAQYPKDLALAQQKLEATVLNLQEEMVKNV